MNDSNYFLHVVAIGGANAKDKTSILSFIALFFYLQNDNWITYSWYQNFEFSILLAKYFENSDSAIIFVDGEIPDNYMLLKL